MEQITDFEAWHQIVNTEFQSAGGIIYSSSGSTQSSKSLIYTKDVMKGAIRRTKELFGLVPLEPPSKIVILWGFGLFPPAHYYALALTEMGNLVYPLGSGKNLSSDNAAKRIYEIVPEVIIGMPSYIIKILGLINNNGWSKGAYNSLKIIVTGGELLTNYYRETIEKSTGARIYDSYGMLQAPMIAGECSHGKLHISREYYPEILNENSEVCSEGKGVLLLSSNQAWYPLKMYRLNTQDKVILNKTECECGCKMPTLSLLGRNNRKLKVRGQMIDFDELMHYFAEKGFAGKYYIEIFKNPIDILKFYISDSVDKDDFEKVIKENVTVSYEIVIQQDLTIPTTDTGKEKCILISEESYVCNR